MSTAVLSLLVERTPDALTRVVGLCTRRGFNIESFAMGECEDPCVLRMTIICRVDGKAIEQIIKQLHKLINVLKIDELIEDDRIERGLALVKVRSETGSRNEILEIVDRFRARVVDVTPESLIIEATGAPEEVGALVDALRPFGIIEMARPGRIALART